MATLLLSASLISFASAIVPGPILAVVLAKGFQSPRGGLYVALGHTITDAIVVLGIYYGLSQFFENEGVKLWLYILGGVLTIFLGVVIFHSRNKTAIGSTNQSSQAFWVGVLATIGNPMFWLWWATAGSMFIMRFSEYDITGILIFILAIELPALIWYTFAGTLAYRTNSYKWGWSLRKWLISASGVLLVGFGLYFIWLGVSTVT